MEMEELLSLLGKQLPSVLRLDEDICQILISSRYFTKCMDLTKIMGSHSGMLVMGQMYGLVSV